MAYIQNPNIKYGGLPGTWGSDVPWAQSMSTKVPSANIQAPGVGGWALGGLPGGDISPITGALGKLEPGQLSDFTFYGPENQFQDLSQQFSSIFSPGAAPAPTPAPMPTLNIPEGVYPKSGSTSMSGSTQSSGIDWDSPIAKMLSGSLFSSAQGLPGLAADLPNNLQSAYTNLMQTALGPEAFQGTLNELARKNMLNSSVAGNAMSNTARNIMRDIGQKAYESQLAGQQERMKVPSILSNIMQLAQRSRGESGSVGTSYSENPLAPYQLLQQFLNG